MNFLDSVRHKSLSERKRLVLILSLISVAVITVVWLTFFNEWRLPSMDISQSSDFQQLVKDAKESAGSIQEQFDSIKQATEEVKQLAEEQESETVDATLATHTFTKKNVEVSLLAWQQEKQRCLISIRLRNLADRPVTFKNFVMRQGFEESTAPLEEIIAPQQTKETSIDFTLRDETPVTAFEIRDTSFSAEESWNYLFALHTPAEPSTPVLPETDAAGADEIPPAINLDSLTE